MVHTIQIKRGTRAQIEAAKAAGQLLDGEPYLITDEDRLAVGVNSNGYSSFAKEGDNTDLTSITGLTGPLSTVEYIDFQSDASPASDVIGRVWYSTSEDTLNIVHADGTVQQVGQEFFTPPTNNLSGVAIPNGSFIMATGAQGDRITIAKAITNGTVDPMYMLGVASSDIAIGSAYNKITTHGIVRDIDTGDFPVGSIIYPDPLVPGWWTLTEPTAPCIRTAVALVLRSHKNTGRIYLRMINATALHHIHDVKIVDPQNGDVLAYNTTTGLWENTVNLIKMNTPAQSSSGIAGQVCIDSDYLYVCVDTNTWKRIEFSSW